MADVPKAVSIFFDMLRDHQHGLTAGLQETRGRATVFLAEAEQRGQPLAV